MDWRDLKKAGGRKVMSFRCIKNIKMFGKSKTSLKLGGERENTHMDADTLEDQKRALVSWSWSCR